VTLNSKAKGRTAERYVATKLGGKRTPLSGGTGGGDVTLPVGNLWADWSVEVKARASLPALITRAFAQAESDIRIGDRRKPLVILKADRSPALAVFRLDDVVAWVEALAQVGRASRVRDLGRELERIAFELKGIH
jgi:hypothetical protein